MQIRAEVFQIYVQDQKVYRIAPLAPAEARSDKEYADLYYRASFADI